MKGRTKMNDIQEHFHLTIADSSGMVELSIYNHDGLYIIRDDDGDFDETIIYAHHTSLLEAVKYAAEFLRWRKPNGHFIRGAGAPPDEILQKAGLI